MKISEYIWHLEYLKAEHGDIQVDRLSFDRRINAPMPVIAYRKLLAKRESKSDFFRSHMEPEQRGEKVVKV